MQYTSRGTQIDTEKCVEMIGNRFQLIIIASARARQIAQTNRNSDLFAHLHTPVSALLEVQEGKLNIEGIRLVK